MRTGGALFHTVHLSQNTAAQATTTAKATFSPPSATIQRSPWHSPVPYLFGGLAAMLGLIAFALLILACSYWRLSGQANNDEGSAAAEKGESSSEDSAPRVFEEKYLVIMAGHVKPTFLATPAAMSGKASSFTDDRKLAGEETEKSENQLTPTADENSEETGGSLRSREQIH